MRQHLVLEHLDEYRLLRLTSEDGTNRLSCACVLELHAVVEELACRELPLLIAGNRKFFSAGADLTEIAALSAVQACEFAKMGQALMNAIANFPNLVCAAIEGYCMGGGLDVALACHARIASRQAIFGHRGAALGLITGWGGTQRLPRLIGKGKALEILTAAEKIHAPEALRIGLVDLLADDPIEAAIRWIAAHGNRCQAT